MCNKFGKIFIFRVLGQQKEKVVILKLHDSKSLFGIAGPDSDVQVVAVDVHPPPRPASPARGRPKQRRVQPAAAAGGPADLARVAEENCESAESV